MHTAFMDTEDQDRGVRLAEARKAKGYNSGAEAARALRMREITYNQYENGHRGFRLHASRLASFYGVRLPWLWEGKGPMKEGGKTLIQEKFDALPPEKQPEALRMLDWLSTQK